MNDVVSVVELSDVYDVVFCVDISDVYAVNFGCRDIRFV